MTSDVVLSAALRSNLLSLQGTQNLIDTTQFRLSTGKKVNSALDNPQSYFASQALTNRANDLTRLLDGIGQSIQVIKAADNGVTALTKLVEQAQSVAQSAQDALAQGTSEAKVVGDRDLRNIDDLTALTGINASDTLIFTVTKDDGTAINIGPYGGGLAATGTITITSNMSTDELISAINNLQLSNLASTPAATGGQAIEASLDSAGHLQLRTLNGGNFNVNFASATPNVDTANLAEAADLGFGSIARLVQDAGAGGAGSNNVEFSAIADVSLKSYGLYRTVSGSQVTALRSTTLNNVNNSSGIALFANLDAATDDYVIGINGGTQQTINLTNAANTAVTIQDFIDSVNTNTSLNTKIVAEFDDDTGVLSIRAIDSSVKSIEIGVADNSVQTANFGFGVNAGLTGTLAEGEQESIQLAAAAGDLAQFEKDFNSIRDQIDALVSNGDTGYRGTNLLNGDDLLTVFNEDRSSTLTTEGVTFTADGLGIDAGDFSRSSTVQGALDQISDALSTVRSFGSTLSNNLAVIQTRQTFTNSLINTLKAGSDLLTVADQNEEGAKLLALQTRQQLGVTALSLASQSQQSILRLF